MLVSETTYYVVVAIIAASIRAFPLYARFVKKQDNKYDIIYFLLLILFPINWYTPTVYTITDCNEFSKEVLLLPTERDGISFGMGSFNYIINNSNKNLYFENVYYGDVKPNENVSDIEIESGAVEKINIISIDYLFTEPDEFVSSKSGGAVKTVLYCLD